MVSVWCMGSGSLERLHASFCHRNGSHFGAQPPKMATAAVAKLLLCCDIICKRSIVHGCYVLNKRGFARPYVLSEHTLVVMLARYPKLALSNVQIHDLIIFANKMRNNTCANRGYVV